LFPLNGYFVYRCRMPALQSGSVVFGTTDGGEGDTVCFVDGTDGERDGCEEWDGLGGVAARKFLRCIDAWAATVFSYRSGDNGVVESSRVSILAPVDVASLAMVRSDIPAGSCQPASDSMGRISLFSRDAGTNAPVGRGVMFGASNLDFKILEDLPSAAQRTETYSTGRRIEFEYSRIRRRLGQGCLRNSLGFQVLRSCYRWRF